METVFLVQHLHIHSDGTEDVKTIGVYRSREDAEDAVIRLKALPGFCSAPHIAGPESTDQSGFYIDEYRVGQDCWNEGFTAH